MDGAREIPDLAGRRERWTSTQIAAACTRDVALDDRVRRTSKSPDEDERGNRAKADASNTSARARADRF
jgi:hypothetical protein